MKIFRYILVLLVLQAIIIDCYSQDRIDGYILTKTGDTVKGEIKLDGDRIFGRNVFAKLGGGINFKATGTTAYIEYLPPQLKGFGYYTRENLDPVRQYAYEKVEKKERFLIIMIDGPLRLYKDVTLEKNGPNTVNVDYLYIKKTDAKLFAIDNNYYKVKKRAPLKKYLGECTAVESILKDEDLDLDKLVKQYNQSCK